MPAEALKHPGDIIRRLIDETGLTVAAAASMLRVSRQQLTRLLGRKSDLSPEMALRIETVFGGSAEELMQRQLALDLAEARDRERNDLDALEPFEGPLNKRNAAYVSARLRKHQKEFEEAGIKHLYLFGSVARGEATPVSDVDIYYEDTPETMIGLGALDRLAIRIRDILDVEKVDLVPGDSFKPQIRKHIDQDAIRIF